MTKSEKSYSEMLKGELLAVAQRLGLTNLSRLRKDEIIDLIKRANKKQAAAEVAAASQGKPASKKKAAAKKKEEAAPSRPAAKAEKASKSSPPARLPAAPAATAGGLEAVPSTSRGSSYLPPTATTASKAASRTAAGPVSPQADAVATKYATARDYRPEELQGIDEDLPPLPQAYGENRIVLLPRDPAWLFAYWNLTPEYKEAAQAAGGRALALHLYDATDVEFDGTNAHATFEHECAEWARSWYLPVPAPGRDYIVEIGYRGGDEWYPLARSKAVAVPAYQPSTWVRDDYATIRFDEDLREVRNRLPEMQGPSEPPALPVTPQTLYDDGELAIVVGGPFFNPLLMNPSGVPNWPLFSAALGGELGGLPGSLAFVPGSLGQMGGSVAFVPGSLGYVPGSLAFVPGSMAFLPGSIGHLAGSLAYHPAFAAALAGGPAEGANLAAQGAAGAGGKPLGQPVLLEDSHQPMVQANIELVISGRSYPGTELSIAGKTIPVGPDGAFSLRISVPEGSRELPIEAKSVISKQTRRLNLRFGRDFE